MARDVLLDRRQFLGLVSGAGAAYAWAAPSDQGAFLYVACPGIRNYLEFGGAGILVFDIRANHAFVRRIVTPASRQPRPENVKGICANATTGRLYFTTLSRLYCLDLRTDETLWEKALPDGCDRLAIHPSGKTLYVPTLEKDHWNIVDALTGDLTARVETKNGAHNTICGPDGKRVYMAGLKAPYLFVLDTESLQVVHKVGPFSAPVRPFTINGRQTRCYVCVNELLGFEVGDLVTGRFLSRVEVKGFARGPVKRHGCPSHGIGMTPDERQIWLCDAANQALHVFEVAGDRFRQITTSGCVNSRAGSPSVSMAVTPMLRPEKLLTYAHTRC